MGGQVAQMTEERKIYEAMRIRLSECEGAPEQVRELGNRLGTLPEFKKVINQHKTLEISNNYTKSTRVAEMDEEWRARMQAREEQWQGNTRVTGE